MPKNLIVQYVIVREDLLKQLKWSVGAVIAQACHASIAAVHLFASKQDTKDYLVELNAMHKIVLQTKNEDSLMELSKHLTSENIDFKLWFEQPENIPTCLALRPYSKDNIQHFFKKLQLFK